MSANRPRPTPPPLPKLPNGLRPHLAGRVWAAGRRQARAASRLGFDPAHILLVLWAGLLLSPLWLGLVVEAPLRYPAPLDVLEQPAVAGDPLVLRETRCNHNREALTYPFTRSLRREGDGVVYLLAPGSSTAKPGCTTVETPFNLLPPYLAPGTYTLYGVASVAAWNRSYSVPYSTHPFEVVQPTPQPLPTATPRPLPTVTVTPTVTPSRRPMVTVTPLPPTPPTLPRPTMTPRGATP